MNHSIQSVDDLHALARQAVAEHPTLDDVGSRLQATFADGLHDPFLFEQMEAVVDRVVQAVQAEEHIVVFSDFDTDGIPSAAMWHDLFATVEHDAYEIYIPKRDIEGFGLKPKQVEEFTNKADLLITVDCGIRSHTAVETARDAGVDVVILDHHVPAETTPQADAIVNPALPDSSYPCSGLCGAGVTFKVFQALAEDGRVDLPENFTKGQLGLTAIATISDMVPLVGENQTIAKLGLEMLRNTSRPGLRELYEQGRIQGRELTAVDVGFTIGSHINAASRLDQPKLAYKLLVTRNHQEGKRLAKKLHSVYRKRKRLTSDLKQAVSKQLEGVSSDSAVVLGDENWKPALLGPVAHRVTDAYQVPAFLWGRANGKVKGSARATGHDVVSMLQAVADDHLNSYGGHQLAGGFELSSSPSPAFADDLSNHVERFQIETDGDVTPVPAELVDMDWSLFSSLESLGPFGAGCQEPLFRLTNLNVQDKRTFGSGNGHVSLTVTDGSETKDAVAFFADEKMKQAEVGDTVSLVGALEKTTFGFDKKLRFRMEHLNLEARG